MNIEQLIAKLTELKNTYGNVEITTNDECGYNADTREDLVYAYVDNKGVQKVHIEGI